MESWPIDEGFDERFLVRCQLRLPTFLADQDTQPHGARVRHELGAKSGTNPVARAVESINQSTGLLELDREEVSRRDVLASALDAVSVVATLEYLIAPEVEAGFVRFTTEEIEVVLPHEIFRSVQRVRILSSGRRAKGCFRRFPNLAEGTRGRTEGVVNSRRRDGIEAVCLHVFETIEAVRVGDELAVLRALQSDHRAFNWIAVVVNDAAGDHSARGRRRERAEGPSHRQHCV